MDCPRYEIFNKLSSQFNRLIRQYFLIIDHKNL